MTDDLVMEALDHLTSVLRAMKPRGALLNGNIEVFLKTCFASYFDSQAGQGFSYVMDKYFEKKQIDFLLLKNQRPILAIEFKCTLAVDSSGGRKAARRAIEQAMSSVSLLAPHGVRKLPSYAVHFLCAHYPQAALPAYIWDKLPGGERRPKRVLEIYSDAARLKKLSRPKLSDVIALNKPMLDVHLEVIVARVKG